MFIFSLWGHVVRSGDILWYAVYLEYLLGADKRVGSDSRSSKSKLLHYHSVGNRIVCMALDGGHLLSGYVYVLFLL